MKEAEVHYARASELRRQACVVREKAERKADALVQEASREVTPRVCRFARAIWAPQAHPARVRAP